MKSHTIKHLDTQSVHRISSGQVVIDLQTAVKELLENSLDAGSNNIEVRFKEYGLNAIEVIDNGSGIAPEDYEAVALKHHTSKLASFEDLSVVKTFGFRGEALSSLCAVCESVIVTTATASEAPMGTILNIDRSGKVQSPYGKAARQRGTTVTVSGLFKALPVRRKEFERNAKREYGKALNLLSAYALVPCAQENKGIRLTVTHFLNGKRIVPLKTDGLPALRSSMSALWGPKVLDNVIELELHFEVEPEKSVLKRQGLLNNDGRKNEIIVRGLMSKFAVGCGRSGTDRQFFFINGRPCNPSKVQKAFNEVYRTFNANQSPLIVADFVVPTDACDINVSPDKRTILLHSENNLIQALKIALEEKFSTSRATYDVQLSQTTKKLLPVNLGSSNLPLFLEDDPAPSSSVTDAEEASNAQNEVEITPVEGVALVEPPCPDTMSARLSSPSPGRGRSCHETPQDFTHSFLLSAQSPALVSQSLDPPRPKQTHPDDHRISDGKNVDIEIQGSFSESAKSLTSSRSRTKSLCPESHNVNPVCGSVDIAESVVEVAGKTTANGGSVPRDLSSISYTAVTSKLRTSTPSDSHSNSVDITDLDTGQSDDRPRQVQTVLNTSGAAWNLRRSADRHDESDRPRKKPRGDDGFSQKTSFERKTEKYGNSARQDLRLHLQDYARKGSQQDVIDGSDMPVDATANTDESEDDPDEDVRHMLEPRTTREMPRELSNETQFLDIDEDLQISNVIDPTCSLHSTRATSIPEYSGPSEVMNEPVAHPEVIRTTNGDNVTLQFNMSHIALTWHQVLKNLSAMQVLSLNAQAEKPTSDSLVRDAGLTNTDDEDRAADILSRVIDKSDFTTMDVVGQFNHGFIITRRRKYAIPCDAESTHTHGSRTAVMDDMFIVDQHAADEKYNFETLQLTTKIQSQMLIRPHVLELSAADEILATENVEVLRQNGFEINVEEESNAGRHINLVAQPLSNNTVFDMKDMEELLHLMRDRPTGYMVRCTKARAMFAMRACRKSFMVGMPLNQQQMTSVIRHMGTMEQPWHCPHGRPTMRHLSDILNVGWNRDRNNERSVDWMVYMNDLT